jgi:hypothetical protein
MKSIDNVKKGFNDQKYFKNWTKKTSIKIQQVG